MIVLQKPAEAPAAPLAAGAAGSRDYVRSGGAVHCKCHEYIGFYA